MEKIQPVGNYVLLEQPKVEEQKSAGGIIIPDSAKEKPSEGIVAGVAVEATDEIAIGDKVIYKSYSGTEITHDSKDYLLIQDSDIIAKFVEVDAI